MQAPPPKPPVRAWCRMTEIDYWRDRSADNAPTHPIPPPRWTTALPDEWEQERERCAAMSRAARAHMPDLVPMLDAWRIGWDRRARAYAIVVEVRNRAAVAAVVDEVTPEDARLSFRQARAAEAERRALIALPWDTVAGGGER